MNDDLTTPQVQSLRWILMQVAEAAAPYRATEAMCLDVAGLRT